MKLFFREKFSKKIIIIFLVISIVFNVFMPTYSYGWDLTGAILVKPIASFVVVVVDGFNLMLQAFLGGLDYTNIDNWQDLNNEILASPDKIFTNQYPILNANLFSAKSVNRWLGYRWGGIWDEVTDGAGTNAISNLKNAIASIYYLLRNLGAIILLCLLIYTGIRIVLSARAPEEQAKWKGYLIDWLKALCLLVFMHIIMISIFDITELLASSLAEKIGNDKSITSLLRGQIVGSWDSMELIVITILYIYSTYLTIVFAFAYFRRVLWTAILIVIAPIVAVLYAVGNDGKQIYQQWLREFIVNCLIQPFHIIVYYVLIMIPVMITQ